MGLEVKEQGDVHVISVDGEMVAGDGDSRLKQAFEDLLDSGHLRVVIDLRRVPYIDSSVLGQLVYGHSRLLEQGGGLRLLSPSTRVRNLLELTRLIRVFDVYEDEGAVLAGW